MLILIGHGGVFVDDDGIDLAADQCLDGERAVVVLGDLGRVRDFLSLVFSRGTGLDADLLALEVVQGGNGAVRLQDNGLGGVEVFIREITGFFPGRIDRKAGGDDVDLAKGLGQGLERHVLNFKLQFQLVGDGLHDVHVDTGKAGALFIFEGRELGVGPHNQGAFLNEAQFRSPCGGSIRSRSRRTGARIGAAGGQGYSRQDGGQANSGQFQQLFHTNLLQ